MLTRERHAERGFSLVELIIAVAMLAIVLGTVATASMVSSNAGLASQARVKLAAALEQAVERIHLQQPWYGTVPQCATIQTSASGTCTYPFDVSSTERFTFRADVVLRRLGTGRTTFDVSTTVTAIDRATGQPVTQLRPIRTSFVKDLRKKETGDIAVFSCRVDQADDRMAGGSCATPNGVPDNVAYSSWTPMAKPHGAPDRGDAQAANKCGGDWLLPPYQAYGKTCPRLEWFEVMADNRDRINFLPNSFTATATNTVTGEVRGTPGGGAPGRFRFTDLERGTWNVRVTETNDLSTYRSWPTKSTGNLINGSSDTYRVVVTPGTQARVTRIFEPRPVNVTLPIIVGDAAIPWEPRHNADIPVNDANVHNYAALIPLPEGRVTIPGVSAAEYAACPSANRNTVNDVCDAGWGRIRRGATSVTFRDVRPGLYRQQWYQSARNSEGEWVFKQRSMSKADLGYGWPNGRWNSRFSQHGRLGYLWVHPNGQVSTANASPDGNITVRFPGCTSRRELLTLIFAEVPNMSDGTERWIYQSAADGRIYPSSLWDQMSPGLQARALASAGDAAVGWVRRVERRTDAEGDRYSIYRAANGNWNDAVMKTEYSKREYVDGPWSEGLGDPNGRILYYRWQRLNGDWEYLQEDRATAIAKANMPRRVQYKVKWSDWKPWQDDPYTINEQDIPRTREVIKEDAQGYRAPIHENRLYNMNPGVGVTDFTVYDRCSSSNKELDADGDGLV